MARFFRRGVTKIYFCPSLADPSAPTSGEISGGTDLSGRIAAISGFQLKNNPITTPDLVTTFDPQIPGVDSADSSELTFYSDDTSDSVKTALTKNTAGFLVFAMRGSATGAPAETWPVTVTHNAEEYTLGNEAARYMVGFSVTSIPVQDAVMP
jgi:hypothetical protein